MKPCDNEEAVRAVRKAARKVGGRVQIPCRTALKLADRLGLSPARIGALCDREKIRIRACQLGCFE